MVALMLFLVQYQLHFQNHHKLLWIRVTPRVEIPLDGTNEPIPERTLVEYISSTKIPVLYEFLKLVELN